MKLFKLNRFICFIAIRAPISKGNITLYDLSTSLPLDDTKIVKVSLTGSEILAALEYSVHRLVILQFCTSFIDFPRITFTSYHLNTIIS